jgi:hypothetical protein
MPPIDPNHSAKQSLLRKAGITLLVVGGGLTAFSLYDFFAAFGRSGGPRYFWCFFLGGPLMTAGAFLTNLGFIGAVARYMGQESVPVAKDTFNYLADGTKDGVRTVAKAIGEGLGLRPAGQKVSPAIRCPKCGHETEPSAKFCDSCGAAMTKTKSCPACTTANEGDARFCRGCGKKLEL